MARTESNMLPLGTEAPNFSLPDTITGKNISLEDYNIDNGLLIMFICNHCPFVIHVIEEVVNITKEYSAQGIGFIAISANDVVRIDVLHTHGYYLFLEFHFGSIERILIRIGFLHPHAGETVIVTEIRPA